LTGKKTRMLRLEMGPPGLMHLAILNFQIPLNTGAVHYFMLKADVPSLLGMYVEV
jgi:hypothetical protein